MKIYIPRIRVKHLPHVHRGDAFFRHSQSPHFAPVIDATIEYISSRRITKGQPSITVQSTKMILNVSLENTIPAIDGYIESGRSHEVKIKRIWSTFVKFDAVLESETCLLMISI